MLDETSLNQQAEKSQIKYLYSTLFILPKAKKIILNGCYSSKQVNFQQKKPLKINFFFSSSEISASFTENTSVISESGCQSFRKRFCCSSMSSICDTEQLRGLILIDSAFRGPSKALHKLVYLKIQL